MIEVNELLEISFEELEKKIFTFICDMGRDITVYLLEQLDEYLMKNRDRKRYISKQTRKVTIKTVYGEVEYSRRMYFDAKDKRYVYLLDDNMQMERIGSISSNLAKRIAEASIDMSYRKAASTISKTTGQSISSHGAWNVVQQIGDVIQTEEKELLREMNSEKTSGTEEAKVIFMEADGVHLHIQNNKKKAPSKELKLSTIYDGWVCDGKRLHNKKVFAGMEKADIFNRKTEALIQSVYDTSVTELRVVNGDGAAWIKNTYEPDVIFQLDRFHIKQEITRCITSKNTQKMIFEKLHNNKIDEMLEVIDTYINSIDDGTNEANVKKAKTLYNYLHNNYEGLLPWQIQAGRVPEAPEGITYKNMGVQENQNCSLVCMRMKGRKMRWSINGANNLAKLIYMKENGELDRIIEKTDGKIIIPEEIDLSMDKVLSADKIKEKVGKGNKWMELIQVTMPMIKYNGPYADLLRSLER